MLTPKEYAAALRSLWCDRCTVYVMQNSEDDNSPFSEQEWSVLFEAEPCRMTHKSVTITNDTDHAASTYQSTVLILDKAKEIPPGSKISVTHEGVTRTYERSGVAAVFSVHQEVPVTLKEAWA